MGRDNAGTYTLAAGNPVSPNTTISSTWANSTLNDLANGLTNSLSRTGLGAMQAPLRIKDGISGAPGLTFDAETTSGFYRADDGILGLSLLGVNYLTAGDGEILVPKVLHGTNGLTITQSASNTAGATITGNGTAAGATITGGATGRGLTVAAGGGNANGLNSTGAGAGVGAVLTGGATGAGATISAGGGNAVGATITGAGTGYGLSVSGAIGVVATGTVNEGVAGIGAAGQAGVKARAGTAATASAAQTALYCEDGYLGFRKSDLSAAVNPNKDVAFTNTITPIHMLKAWVRFRTDGFGGVTALDGLNVSGVAVVGGDVEVTFASAFANTDYTMMGNVYQGFLDVIMNSQTTTVAAIRAGTQASGSIGLNVTPLTVDVWFVGRQ